MCHASIELPDNIKMMHQDGSPMCLRIPVNHGACVPVERATLDGVEQHHEECSDTYLALWVYHYEDMVHAWLDCAGEAGRSGICDGSVRELEDL